ncbi:hypothetical protein F5Y07DRAFT_394123 [Xylaria sp. FL0933]|nr:hypothetical protein F5Y07DRAFT_394123 [Xylaria sp. FL0933]
MDPSSPWKMGSSPHVRTQDVIPLRKNFSDKTPWNQYVESWNKAETRLHEFQQETNKNAKFLVDFGRENMAAIKRKYYEDISTGTTSAASKSLLSGASILFVRSGCPDKLYLGSSTDSKMALGIGHIITRIHPTYLDLFKLAFKKGYTVAYASLLCWTPLPFSLHALLISWDAQGPAGVAGPEEPAETPEKEEDNGTKEEEESLFAAVAAPFAA